jgi:hypothetical protein
MIYSFDKMKGKMRTQTQLHLCRKKVFDKISIMFVIKMVNKLKMEGHCFNITKTIHEKHTGNILNGE